MPDLITSRQNPLVKQLAEIRDGRDTALLFLEGPRLVKEVLKTKQVVEILIWTPSADGDPVLEEAKLQAKRLFKVAASVFEAISDVDAPQGILAIARASRWTWTDLVKRTPAPMVILDGVQDPGNAATIVRTAEAAGAAGVVTTPGTAHLTSPKALRGGAGSALRLPSLEHVPAPDIVRELKKARYQLLAAVSPGKETPSIPYTEVIWNQPTAFLLGREGQGLTKVWESQIDHFIHIPIASTVESLNVAVAAALLLFEAQKHPLA